MNCVNSISQMNSVSCEHSSLIPQEKKGPPPEEGQGGPEKRPPDEGNENKPGTTRINICSICLIYILSSLIQIILKLHFR